MITKTTKEAENFPYESYTEFKDEINSRKAVLSINQSNALQLIGGLTSKNGGVLGILLPLIAMFATFGATIAFLIFIIVQGAWWWLLSIPALLIFAFMSTPGFKALTGKLYSVLVFGSFIGLFLTLDNEIAPWFFLTAIVMWACAKFTYRQACKMLEKEILSSEDMAVKLWNTHSFGVLMSSGQLHDVAGNFQKYQVNE